MSEEYKTHVKTQIISDYLKNLISDKVKSFDPLIYKISHFLNNENEISAFTNLMAICYESGFSKSSEMHKEALAKIGLSTNLNFNEQKSQDVHRLEDISGNNLQERS